MNFPHFNKPYVPTAGTVGRFALDLIRAEAADSAVISRVLARFPHVPFEQNCVKWYRSAYANGDLA